MKVKKVTEKIVPKIQSAKALKGILVIRKETPDEFVITTVGKPLKPGKYAIF